MKNASKLNSNLPPLSLPLKGGEVEGADFFALKGGEGINCEHSYPKGEEEMNCEYLSLKGGETTPSINLPLSGREATSSINLPLSGEEQKRGLFKNHNSQSAFTLIELAIVLVIVGLITVGVVGGQSIIQSSKRQAVISDVNKIKMAVNAFKLEFDGIPGDFNEATDYWPGETRDGNNDKKISDIAVPTEAYLFWDHLNLSGVYPSTTVRDYHNQHNPSSPELTYPKSPLNSSYYALSNRFFQHSVFERSLLHRSTNISIVNIDLTSTHYSPRYYNPSSTPNFAYSIDKKIDDGKPIFGKVGATGKNSGHLDGTSAECHERPGGWTDIDSTTYNLENNDDSCTLLFILHDKNGKF